MAIAPTGKIILVTTNKDSGPGSLRCAISEANGNDNSIIIIEPSVGNHIVLTEGSLTIKSNMIIVNKTHCDLTISQKCLRKRNSIFHVSNPTASFELSSAGENKIILKNGKNINGGAIYSDVPDAKLILNNVILSHNRAKKYGGALYSLGHVTLTSCLITENKAGSQGGGIWSGSTIILQDSNIVKNKVTIAHESSGGAGLYMDSGDLIADKSHVSDNHVAYEPIDDATSKGGSGGGIICQLGSLYLTSSHVDNNSAFNSAGIQIGSGNVYLLNSSINDNQSFNNNTGSAGGGGITITKGTVTVSNSEISNNKTSGMFSGGIVSILGDVVVTNSKIKGNSNHGPGGAIACNNGDIVISNSRLQDNTGASLGGALVTFKLGGSINVLDNSHIANNTLTNSQTIIQTIGAFLTVIKEHLRVISTQSQSGQNSKLIDDIILDVINKLTPVDDELKKITIKNEIGGGAIGNILPTYVSISDSNISNNFAGKAVSKENEEFGALGGALFGYSSTFTIKNSIITNNETLTSGGALFLARKASATVINSTIRCNSCSNRGGAIATYGILRLFSSQIKHNKAKEGGGVYSNKIFVKSDTIVEDNCPNNIVIENQ